MNEKFNLQFQTEQKVNLQNMSNSSFEQELALRVENSKDFTLERDLVRCVIIPKTSFSRHQEDYAIRIVIPAGEYVKATVEKVLEGALETKICEIEGLHFSNMDDHKECQTCCPEFNFEDPNPFRRDVGDDLIYFESPWMMLEYLPTESAFWAEY